MFYCKYFSEKNQAERGKKGFLMQMPSKSMRKTLSFQLHFGVLEGPPGPIRRKKAVFLKAKKGSGISIHFPNPEVPAGEHALAGLRSILGRIDPNFGGLRLFDQIFSLHSTAATDWPGLRKFFFAFWRFG